MDGLQLNAIQFIIFAIVGIVSGGGAAAIIQWRAQAPKVKAEAAKLNAETHALKVDDQTQIIEDLRNDREAIRVELKSLSDRVERLETRNDKLRSALLSLTQWVQRVLAILTPEQRDQVGEPPNTDHLINT